MKRFSVKSCAAMLLAGVTFTLSGALSAAQLVLTNGDKLQGTLVSVDGTSLVWKSDSFGELTIKKEKVASFSTVKKVKIQGVRQPCLIDGMDGYHLNYRCGEDDRIEAHSKQLMALDSIVPYVEFQDNGPQIAGKLSLKGAFERGNTIQDDVDVDGRTSYRDGDWRHVGTLDYDSESTNDDPAIEDYDVNYRLDWFVSEQWFYYNEVGVGQEEAVNVDERYTYSTGAGVQLWEDPNSALSFENGLLYKKELLDPTPLDLTDPHWDSRTEVWYNRFATNFRYRLPFSAVFFHTNEVLYSLRDSQDWEFSADFGLSVPLGLGLFSEYKFEYDYDHLPSSPDAEKEDTKFTFGLGYEW